MCGVIGVCSPNSTHPISQTLFNGLTLLQHRGQDATGIMTLNNSHLRLHKRQGLVREVYRTRHIQYLEGDVGIGHVRYPTAGSYSNEETQPLYVNSPYGIALCHNGNIINTIQLAKELEEKDFRHINTRSDSEVLLNTFADELSRHGEPKLEPEAIFKAISQLNQRVIGAYATVGMIVGFGLVAFRDPFGLRPLIYGKREKNGKTEWAIASESIALTAQDFTIERDIAPGEAILIDLKGNIHSKICHPNPQYRSCIFEYVYFSRPDSIVDGISVYQARLNMGHYLAQQVKNEWADNDIDVIMPVPDTSRPCAIQMASALNIDYREGFIKNRYIGRTFIMQEQEERTQSVKQKLNTVNTEFKDKKVLLVDDSIVRGTTSKEIVTLARRAGAKKVYFASASPPVKHPYVYGIDIPTSDELIASQQPTLEQLSNYIGADKIIFQKLSDLIKSVADANLNKTINQFDTSCFDGKYSTGHITEEYLLNIAKQRKQSKKKKTKKKGYNDDATLYNKK